MWRISGIVLFTLVLSVLNVKMSLEDYKIVSGSDSIDPPFYSADSVWVDSVFNSLSPDERIAQLLMVQAYSDKGAGHEQHISELISEYGIGGLIFMQGGPYRQVNLINKYQSISKVPSYNFV